VSYSVSQLARRCGISRTTVLYYEREGLLQPATRTEAGYRRYGEAEAQRLDQIRQYREAGLPIERIAALLDGDPGNTEGILLQRLRELNREIAGLRSQQQVIVQLLSVGGKALDTRIMSKERWVDLLRRAGFSDEAMWVWHKTFEAQAPEAHQDFLEGLGMASEEIADVRRRVSAADS
jgi:DNA-binding transcriptional MerR regulator